ncbi:MAG TPA: carboxypeptidase regulatory-like domain-containing protein [Kofleriaceae bacterium]|nr:carboxypeptidase regulatory-like domain-containing protein [Kofleriaceae bacterium]
MTRTALGHATPVALALAVAGLLPVLPGPAAAGPVVAVRARTAITLDPIRRSQGGLNVRGRVHERGSDQPVPYGAGAGVAIALDDHVERTSVDEDGRFMAWFATSGGRHRLSIQFAGGGEFEGSTFTLPELDVAKQPLNLSLRVPDQHRRGRGPLSIEVQASGESEPAQVVVAISLGGAEQENPPALGRWWTNRLGRAPFLVPVQRLGPPGPKVVRATFAGDDSYDPASVENSFLVVSATRLRFEARDIDVRFEGRVRGRGVLTDDLGAGLVGQSVSLVADLPGGRRVLDESLTGSDGAFELDAPASEIGAGKHMVQAVFESPRPFLESSRSQPAQISVAERRPVPVGYSLAAFAATAASIVAFVGLRTRPWTRWLRRLRGESARPGGAEERDAAPHTGLSQARPGLVSTLRRPHDRGFTGTVSDAITGEPIAGAEVRLGADGLETGADGRFAFEDAAEGELRAQVSSSGYVTESFDVTIPHRGELRDARVDLLPVRERIFQLYREAAEPLLPRPDLWGVWTPRQIFDHVRTSRPARALAELTDYVEEKYFSARVPAESELPRAVERVAAARVEQAPPGLGP